MTVEAVAAPEPALTLRARLRHERVLHAALALIAVQLVFRAFGLYGSWFTFDDFNFISRMGESLTPYNASRSYFGHVMPGAMYLTALNHAVLPWQWTLPATELLVLQAGADLALLYLLVTLFGVRRGILPPLALFLFWAISIEGGIWWAAAINLIPFEIALFMGLAHHVRYLRDGRLRHAVVANLWIVFGLLFNEKSALVYVSIALFTLCYNADGAGAARVRSAVRGRTAALVVYAVTGAVHLAAYVAVGRDFKYDNVFGYPTFEVVRNLVVRAYVPALAGGPFQWLSPEGDQLSIADPGDGLVLASLVLVGLVLNELLRHRTRAARALTLPVAFLIIDVVLVLVTRTRSTGPVLVLAYRYQGEMAAVTAIGLGLMAMPILGMAGRSSARRSSSELLDHPRRVTALVTLVAALGTWSAAQYTVHFDGVDRAEHWIGAVRTALATAPEKVDLVDSPVPIWVTNGLYYPENLQSGVLRGSRGAHWTDVATDRLWMLDDAGRVVPALVPATRRALPGPVPSCGYAVGGDAVVVPLDGPLAYGGWWVRIGYLASGDSAVRVTTGDRSIATTVRSGVHALYLKGGGEFDSVTISGLANDVQLCTDDITAGRPEPLEDNQGASP